MGGAIGGVVTDAQTNALLAGVTVHATSRASPDGPGFTAITGEDGHYDLANLPAGTYDLAYYYDDIETKHRNVRIRDGVVERIDHRIHTHTGEHSLPMPYGAPPARRRVV